jgi:hypothetical protein
MRLYAFRDVIVVNLHRSGKDRVPLETSPEKNDACMGAIIGVQLVAFACFTKAFAITEGLLPEDPKFAKALRLLNLQRGLITGVLICLGGAAILAWSVHLWSQINFGSLLDPENLRRIILAVTLIAIGLQIVFSSLFLGVLGLKSADPGRG